MEDRVSPSEAIRILCSGDVDEQRARDILDAIELSSNGNGPSYAVNELVRVIDDASK